MLEDEEFSLAPSSFFQVTAPCRKIGKGGLEGKTAAKYWLPNISELSSGGSFAEVAAGWSDEGLEFFVEVKEPPLHTFYPAISRGDSIELFIDTRDVKTSGYNTRFCHHFFFLPIGFEGVSKGEITRFRTDDRHELCDPEALELKIQKTAKGYTAKIFTPAQCLQGYDPGQCDHIGFTYRINRYGGSAQHYSVDTEDYQLDEQPSLWSHLALVS